MNLKNVLIIGDSYSTFKGWVPDGFGTSYSEEETDQTDVRRVEETWWHQVITETDSKLVMNNSWSGSTICHTGYNGQDLSNIKSFIYRFDCLKESAFFKNNEINTVFVFGGTNDSWANSPIGEFKYSNWEKQDLYSFRPAICYLLDSLKKTLPDARIICLINCDLKDDITNGIKTACEYYGVESIKFEKVEKMHGHPTVNGMRDIKDAVLKAL